MSSAIPSSFKPIQRNNSTYHLDKTLGKGSFGTVYLAKKVDHLESSGNEVTKLFAVKVIETTPKNKEKVEHEAQMISRISPHPNVMGFEDAFRFRNEQDQELTALVTELIEGKQLFDLIVERGRLDIGEAMDVFGQLVMATKHCHNQDIVHRDLKPENIVIDPNTLKIKVADFGLSRVVPRDDQGRCTPVKTSCGTPHYMAPEVVLEKEYDPKKSEVWTLGVLLYIMLAGSMPFDHENLTQLVKLISNGSFYIPPHISAEKNLEKLLKGMIRVDVNRRLTLDEVIQHPFCRKYAHDFNEIKPQVNWTPTPISFAPTPSTGNSNSETPAPFPIPSPIPAPTPTTQTSPSPDYTVHNDEPPIDEEKSFTYFVPNPSPSLGPLPLNIVYSQTVEDIIYNALSIGEEKTSGYLRDFENVSL